MSNRDARSMDLPRLKQAKWIYNTLVRFLKTKPRLTQITKPGGDVRIKVDGKRVYSELRDLTIWFAPTQTKTYFDERGFLAIGAHRVRRDTDTTGEPWEIALALAERAKTNIIHELVHYLDKQRMGKGWDAAVGSYPVVDQSNLSTDYYNHPIELNAYFMQGLEAASEKVQAAMDDIDPDRPNENAHFAGAWALQEWLQDTTFRKFRRDFWHTLPKSVAKNLTRENKKRLEGRLYQAWDDLRDKGMALWAELEQKDPTTVEFLGPLKTASEEKKMAGRAQVKQMLCPVCGEVHGPDPKGAVLQKHRRDLMLVPPAKVREWIKLQKQMRGEGWRPRLASKRNTFRIASEWLEECRDKTASWAGSGYGGTLSPSVTKAGEGSKIVAAGGELHGWDKYAQLVAEAYQAAPKQSGDGVKAFQKLQDHIIRMFQRMQSRVEIEFVEDDPYQSAAQMEREVKETGVLKVYTGFNQADAWDRPEINLMLRAVHDFAAHLGSMGKGKTRAFTQKGELQSYNKHLNLVGCQSKAAGALFTEIVGQASYFHYYGRFPVQKVTLLDDFDWCKLGNVRGWRIVDGDLVR